MIGEALMGDITKNELEGLLKQGRKRKELAQHYGVSIRTVGRYIKRYGLLGIAKRGRPPKPKKLVEIQGKRRPRLVRTYRMTIASYWYDKQAQQMQEYEMHFKIARYGNIRRVRRHLAERCIPYFQQTVYRLFNRWIPKWKVRAAFEREQPALKSQQQISIEVRKMEGKGRRWKAYPLPSKVLSYVKKKRKRKGK